MEMHLTSQILNKIGEFFEFVISVRLTKRTNWTGRHNWWKVGSRCHFRSWYCLRFVSDVAAGAADVELVGGADAAIGVVVTLGFV